RRSSPARAPASPSRKKPSCHRRARTARTRSSCSRRASARRFLIRPRNLHAIDDVAVLLGDLHRRLLIAQRPREREILVPRAFVAARLARQPDAVERLGAIGLAPKAVERAVVLGDRFVVAPFVLERD